MRKCLAYSRSSINVPSFPSSPLGFSVGLREKDCNSPGGEAPTQSLGTSWKDHRGGRSLWAQVPRAGMQSLDPCHLSTQGVRLQPQRAPPTHRPWAGFYGGIFKSPVNRGIHMALWSLDQEYVCSLFAFILWTPQIQRQIPVPPALAWNQIPSSNFWFVFSIPTPCSEYACFHFPFP